MLSVLVRNCRPLLSRRPNILNSIRSMESYIAALDQGTTSTRCLLFRSNGKLVTSHQVTFENRFPQPG